MVGGAPLQRQREARTALMKKKQQDKDMQAWKACNVVKDKIPWVRRLLENLGHPQDVATYEDMMAQYVYLRSCRNLIDRSGLAEYVPSWARIRDALEYVFSKEGFGEWLEIREVVTKLIMKGIGPDVAYSDKKAELEFWNVRKKSAAEVIRAQEYLKEAGRLNRAANWRWRLEQAITEAVQQGWYPLFGTYTVDPKRLPEGCLTRDELWTKTPAWDRFVKKIKTEVAQACGYGRKPAKWPKGTEFFQYLAVLEHGASGDHPHVHVIWLCKNIPDIWKNDPNANCRDNTRVDIGIASSFWKHGVQRKTMALFIRGSWFEQNWIIPIDERTGKPRKVGGPGGVSGYIGKYMTKGVTKKWNHRIKATQGLGLKKLLNDLNEQMPMSRLLALTRRPNTYDVSMTLQAASSCPMNLMREHSKTVLMRRVHSSKTEPGRDFLRRRWTKEPSGFFSTLICNVRAGARPWKLSSQCRYKLFTLIMGELPSTAHSKSTVLDLVDWLCYKDGNQGKCKPLVMMKGEYAI